MEEQQSQEQAQQQQQHIQSGSLANAGESLMRVSKWLLSKFVNLGMFFT